MAVKSSDADGADDQAFVVLARLWVEGAATGDQSYRLSRRGTDDLGDGGGRVVVAGDEGDAIGGDAAVLEQHLDDVIRLQVIELPEDGP